MNKEQTALDVSRDIEVAKVMPQQAAQEPVEYQYRSRPTWFDEDKGWSAWTKCSRESYETYLRLPVYNDWQYEGRALYAAPKEDAAVPADLGAREPTEQWEGEQMDAFNAWMATASKSIHQYSAMCGWMQSARRNSAATATHNSDDEREAFEAWVKASGGDIHLERVGSGAYSNLTIECEWEAWQARAALAAASQGAPKEAARIFEGDPTRHIRFDFVNADGNEDSKVITHDEMRERYATLQTTLRATLAAPAVALQEAAQPVAMPQAWRESLEMTVERLEADARTHDRMGNNSTAEDRRARAYEITQMLHAAPITQQDSRNAVLEEAAQLCETAEIPFDIRIWANSTKQDMTAKTAHALAAAIRALKNDPAQLDSKEQGK